ncbi:unnamed protein product [Phytophthora fragariaefolia]|uniref:Unnamed protein product n=1 Tax=Phytophthora fragariaefolia TaxID=1490495 RepID=A0A9W7CUX8_9STRA|nr:unnamed protein product [Phytophthora fragariaefolia]
MDSTTEIVKRVESKATSVEGSNMTPGRRRFDALPDDGYTEDKPQKLDLRTPDAVFRTQHSGLRFWRDDPSSSDYLPDLYPEGPSRFQV